MAKFKAGQQAVVIGGEFNEEVRWGGYHYIPEGAVVDIIDTYDVGEDDLRYLVRPTDDEDPHFLQSVREGHLRNV